jgi:IS30 family transposase
MDRPYRHFTLEERRTLFRLLNAKLPIKEIAAQLGRHRSTIYREIARNEFREVRQYRGYYPVTAGSASSSATHTCAAISGCRHRTGRIAR